MAVPLILSEVPDATPYIQYVATNGQTVFPYPFPITQDSDLIVVVGSNTLPTDSGYTLSGQGNDTGGNVTFTLGQTAGAVITLYRDIAIERISQFAQNSGFSSTTFNAEFNNVYLIMQQLEVAIEQCLQIPVTNNPAPTTLLTPANYANKYLSFDANGNPQPTALTSLGAITAAILGSLLYPQTAAEASAGVVPAAFQYAPLDIRRYGAVLNGSTNDAAAWQSAFNVAVFSGGMIFAPPGTSFVNSQVTAPRGGIWALSAYGCTVTSGAGLAGLFAFVFSTGGNPNGCAVRGLTIDHSSNPGAVGGINLLFNVGMHISDCNLLGATTGGYTSIRLSNSTPGDAGDATGSINNLIEHCTFYNATSSGQIGIAMRNQQNATTIRSCKFLNCQLAGIVMQSDTGGSINLPSAVCIDNCDFEGIGATQYAIWTIHSAGSTGIAGLRCINNRFESATGGYAFGFTGTVASDTFDAPWLSGNTLISNVTYMLNNANITVNSFDFSVTPFIDPSLSTYDDFAIKSVTGNFAFTAQTGGKGYTLTNGSGTVLAALKANSVQGAALVGGTGGLVISATATAGHNLRGSGSTAGATTSTLTFPVAEPDTSYFLQITPTSGGGTIVSIAKGTSSCTITWTASITNTYDWLVVR